MIVGWRGGSTFTTAAEAAAAAFKFNSPLPWRRARGRLMKKKSSYSILCDDECPPHSFDFLHRILNFWPPENGTGTFSINFKF